MSDLKQKLIDKLHDPDGDAVIVGYELIDIILEQQAALETVERAYPTSGERMGHQDFAKRALASTNTKLKALGCEK